MIRALNDGMLQLQMELEEKESKHFREAKRGNFEGMLPTPSAACCTNVSGIKHPQSLLDMKFWGVTANVTLCTKRLCCNLSANIRGLAAGLSDCLVDGSLT